MNLNYKVKDWRLQGVAAIALAMSTDEALYAKSPRSIYVLFNAHQKETLIAAKTKIITYVVTGVHDIGPAILLACSPKSGTTDLFPKDSNTAEFYVPLNSTVKLNDEIVVTLTF